MNLSGCFHPWAFNTTVLVKNMFTHMPGCWFLMPSCYKSKWTPCFMPFHHPDDQSVAMNFVKHQLLIESYMYIDHTQWCMLMPFLMFMFSLMSLCTPQGGRTCSMHDWGRGVWQSFILQTPQKYTNLKFYTQKKIPNIKISYPPPKKKLNTDLFNQTDFKT